jgi:transposase
MEKNEPVLTSGLKILVGEEGTRRGNSSPARNRTSGPEGLSVVPNPEVPEKAVRRTFSAEYKRRILREAEACKEPGQLGAFLRREGLYFSNLTTWRRQAEKGTLAGLSPKKRGPIKRRPDPSLRRIAELEKENRKLSHKLKQAELIIEAQKKIAQILQTPLDPDGEKNS